MTRDLLDVGSRVQDSDGFKATIRYKGQVAASKNKEEIWLGMNLVLFDKS